MSQSFSLSENRFHCEYHMSFQVFNHWLELLWHSITVSNAVKSNASSSIYSTNQHIYLKLILAIVLCLLVNGGEKPHCHLPWCPWSFSSIYLCNHSNVPWCCELPPAENYQLDSLQQTTNRQKQAMMNEFLEKSEQQLFWGPGCMHWCYIWVFTAYHQTKKKGLWWLPSSILLSLGIICHMY